MSEFANRVTVGGIPVVLDNDPRLAGGTPTRVPGDTAYRVSADNQVRAFVPIRVEGTMIIDGILVVG